VGRDGSVEVDAAQMLAGAAAVWCAPGSPYCSPRGALDGIRSGRESRVPLLGTCAGFQHGVIEFAGLLAGRPEMQVEIVDPELRQIYGISSPVERYYCRFGVDPAYRRPLHDAGLRIAGVDGRDGDARVMRLADHPFYA
jgi:CTP synthase (UTP-ammonia lyase)